MQENPLYTNRLIHEKSPYLLQHAHNPVDWYPWGEEAFQKAEEEDKPIFLSIGYATCHWCHVMEKESFENIEVAQKMNEAFINIKVDREELPDVDSLYMEFAQSMMSGSGGWPLNVILTPGLEPFFASTYLPTYSSYGLMGLIDLIQRMKELWESDGREKVIDQAGRIVDMFEDSIHTSGEFMPDPEETTRLAELLFKMADPVYGGIKGAPKFPIGYQSSFLLNYYAISKDSRSLFVVERTLNMMYQGGIYDHLGGGFSRYSVDEQWLVPHFEKMLYDNAILAQVYLEGWKMTKNPLYRQVCEEILNYILRDMTHPEGGFYSAEDADSEGREGLFYTWDYQEVVKVLGDDHTIFCEFYGITPEGNFEKRNILHISVPLAEFAARKKIPETELKHTLEILKQKLWQEREKRVHPFKDDKIISSWNGLMIYTLSEAGKAFCYEPYLQAATRAAHFIQKNLWKDGELLRRWRLDEAMFSGSLDEYAFMIRGILSLFEANAGTHWLEWAIEMTSILKEKFKSEDGAFYQTDGTDKNLILRTCQFSDGAEPSANAIHTENLLRLYQITNDDDYLQQAEDVFKGVKDYLTNYPPGYSYHLMNLLWYYDLKSPAIVIALNSQRDYELELKQKIWQNFISHATVVWQNEDVDFEELLPSIRSYTAEDDKTTLYVCFEGACQNPQTNFDEMLKVIEKL